MRPAAPAGAGRGGWLALGLLLLSLLLVLLGAGVGSTGFESLLAARGTSDRRARLAQIVWDIRLPRTLGAWLAGALLGLAGAVAQGLFRNPLADPYLLGSASGASLGVALALAWLFGVPPAGGRRPAWLVRLGLTGAAFVGAVLAVLLTLLLARGVQHTLRLLLAGVIVGVVLGASTSLILLLSPDSLQAMQAFMLGSTGFVGWSACALMAAVWRAVPAGGVGARAACSTAWRWAKRRRAAWACRWRRCVPRWWRCWRWPPARPWRRPG